jgi:hypothetical protein
MSRTIQIIAAVMLGLHGLIHLMGPAVYMKLTEIQGFSYKTTLLGGRVDLGGNGIRIFGALWVLPAIGFITIAVGLVLGVDWWRAGLVAVTLFSLLLTVLDWSVAYAGAVVNIVILAIVFLGPRIAPY